VKFQSNLGSSSRSQEEDCT